MLLAAMAVLTLLAIAALTRPWWRPLPRHAPARRAANVAAYRIRLGEIERDVASGQIPADSAEQLRRESAAQLLGDTDGSAVDDAPPAPGQRWVGALLALLVAGFAGAWYWNGGSWQVQQQIAAAPPAAPDAGQPPPEVAAMVAQLDAKLKANPDDAEGWAMLGRSYFVMHRYLQSANAYHEANARNGGKNGATLAGEGEALAFANGSDVPPQAAELFDRALTADAGNGPALWYGGLADAQAGNFPRARERWTKLEQQDLPPQMRELVEREMKQLASVDGAAPAGETPAPVVASAQAAPAAASPATSLHLTVRLAPALANKVPSGAMLFVFAKADGGPPMPLAVSRQAVGEFPVQLTLDDSMAMAPSLNLSAFDRYVVTARISTSGQALPQSGDLQGTLRIARAEAGKPAEVLIDQAVP